MILEPHVMDLHTRILIVDDDEGIRLLIGDFLAKHGYETTTAADPVEMRKLLSAERFDLIVLDVMMPREDGLTALRQMGPDAPPVIMLSAVGSDVDRIVGEGDVARTGAVVTHTRASERVVLLPDVALIGWRHRFGPFGRNDQARPAD